VFISFGFIHYLVCRSGPLDTLIIFRTTISVSNCIYSRLSGDELSGSKHVDDIKIKILILKMCILCLCCGIVLQCTVTKKNVKFTSISNIAV